ncbi:hypothetical protein P4T54_30320 [Bacillus mycoides]|nr:hypothetical protein [Bacillus mycoides]MED1053002.1 hypothetical protein [Bacillus mycoides]
MKFKTIIEGGTNTHKTINEVVDHVEDMAHFEVDSVALSGDLKRLDVYETIELRGDCVIERIA